MTDKPLHVIVTKRGGGFTFVVFFFVLVYFFVNYWETVLIMAGIAVAFMLVGGWCHSAEQKNAAQRLAERQRKARLIRHADQEHKLIQEGDMDGIYGQYSPPPETRGMGVWLCDDEKGEDNA